jgi:hypothetical protein
MNQQPFELPGSYKKWTIGLLVAGVIALLYGFIMYHPFAHVAHGHGAAERRGAASPGACLGHG